MPLVLAVVPLLRQRVVVGGTDALLPFKQWEPQPSEAKTPHYGRWLASSVMRVQSSPRHPVEGQIFETVQLPAET